MFRGIRFFLKEGWKYSKKYVLWLILGELMSAFIPIAGSLMPKYIIDELMGLQRSGKLVLFVALFAGYAFLAGTLGSYFSRDGFSRRCEVGRQFDLRMNRKLLKTDYANIESPSFRDIHEKAQKFLTCDWHGFGYLLDCAVKIIGQAVTLVGLTMILSRLNLWFVLLFSALAAVSAWIENNAKKQAMKLSMGIVRDQRGMMYFNQVFDDIRFGKEIRLNGISDWVLRKFDAFYCRVNDAMRKQNNQFIRSGVIRAGLTFLQQAAAYALLIKRVLSGEMSVGDFTMCISAITAFAASLRMIMDSVAEICAYDMYYDHLDSYLNLPETLDCACGQTIQRRGHTITMENVSFRYPGADVWALRNINLSISSGEKMALVGENGSGKTTLIKLLCRLYDPTEGVIRIDGKDIREIRYADYQELFSAVFQDFQLFDFSLRENITLGKAAEDQRILDILEKIGLRSRVDSLPKGLETYVGKEFDEQGFLPSGGEAQKIALARALFRDSPFIILDEPTAALDPRTEFELYRSFDALTRGKTVVYITHRLSSTRFCDRIAVLERGILKEYGTHDDLLARRGLYAELYSMQAQFYTDQVNA